MTFIANYIATTMPAQMNENEAAHTFLVENQLGRLSALATDVSLISPLGTQIIQPITLGGQGDPPFAGPDPGKIVVGATGTGMAVNFSLTAPGGGTVLEDYGGLGAFAVELLNAYAPESIVGFDMGGVVYAAPGGLPTFVDTPSITVIGHSATIWMPILTSISIPGDTGTGTTNVVLTLVGAFTQSWPANGYSIPTGSSVTVTAFSLFGDAWTTFYQSQGLTATCYVWGTPTESCPTTFTVGGPVDKVVATLSLTSITLEVGEFSLKVV